MAQVIQLPKGHIGVPASDEKTNTLVNRLISKLKQTKKNIYNKSHQNLKNIKQHVTQNTQLKYFKKLAGKATNSIQKVPKNLKKRIDSVLNHIGSMMASADPISQPTFYQSLVIAFIQKYPCELCDKSNEDVQMPSFEAFYEHVLSIYKHSGEEDVGEEQQALALFFYEEISKEIEDVDYHLMNDIILSSISMTIDSALLGSHTRNQMYLTYKGFVKHASLQNTPLRAKKASGEFDDVFDDDSKLTKNLNESNKDAFEDDEDDDEQQARQSQFEAQGESDKDMNKDLPEMPDIDNIQFETTEIQSQNVDIKFVPFTATLEEFTQRFEGEVIWDQLEDKIAPQTIAQASFEFYQIAQLNLSDIRAKKPQTRSVLSLRSQQRFIKSVFQQLMEQFYQVLQNSENKSLDLYEKSIKWLERQVIGSEQEGEQVVQAFNQNGQIQSISIASKKRRLSNLNQRITNICLFSLGSLYQHVDQKVDFQKWNSYLTPYFESAKPYYHRVKEFSLATYQRINQQVILPMNERVVVVISKGSTFFSVFIKQKMATSKLTETVLQKFNSSRVVVSQQWMRLDFDNDGVVSIQDCKNTARQAYKYLKQEKLIELRESAASLYERSLLRIKSLKAKVMAIKEKSD